MRLTLINQFYTPDISPTAHLCASLAQHRAQRGDRVTIVTSRGGYLGRIQPDQDNSSVRVHRLWTPQFGSRTKPGRLLDWLSFYLVAAVRLMTLERQDVIVAMTTPPCIAWAGALHRLLHPRAKLVLWNMDCWPDIAERLGMIRKGGFASRVMRMMNRALFARLDYLVCLDGAMAELLLANYSSPRPHNWRIIPNWERAALFAAVQDAPPWGDPMAASLRGRFIVLYLGNAGYGHEFETMLDAACQLRDEPVTFLLVGGGAKWDWIDRQRRQRRLANIVLHEYVPKNQTASIMAAADCALITLDDIALGVMSPSKLHAKLAMGLPVIYVGPRGSNVDEAIGRFDCGVSLRCGESEKMAGFIRSLMKDRTCHIELRRRARLAFDESYCDRKTLPQFDTVFDQLSGQADFTC